MIFPMSIYPQSKPLEEGFYLVHNEINDKWIVCEWREHYDNNPLGGWQGMPKVDYFIPYRLAWPTEDGGRGRAGTGDKI